MSVVVLVRHGETDWNARQLLTGWSDPPLNSRGEEQALAAGARLAVEGVTIDQVYTSLLSRAVRSASIMMAAAGATSTPVVSDWRINERHMGLLQGMSKSEITDRWGGEWRRRWRDGQFSLPPVVDPEDPAHPRHDPRYRGVATARLPGGERGYDTTLRVLDFWHERVVADVAAGRNVAVVSHLGPLRIVADHVRHLGREEVPGPSWPHGQPLSCRLVRLACCAPTPHRTLDQKSGMLPWGV